ncbi:MAG: hypothetical protein EOQ56_32645 [Mesorhizobium sp.]|nr:MAG: hypothetical protein EOQ56_32645 [Mesorhizobium sp.]
MGQKNGIAQQWARLGTRPRQPADQRHKNASYSASYAQHVVPGAALALPFADTQAMQLHINEISRYVEKGTHVVLAWRRDGTPPQTSAYRTTSPRSFLPPYRSAPVLTRMH